MNNHAHVLRPDKEVLIDDWLIFFLNYSNLNEFITGVTVPKLNQAKLRSIQVPLPPMDEQRRIVRELNLLSNIITTLQENSQKLSTSLYELKQSILQEAFNGNL